VNRRLAWFGFAYGCVLLFFAFASAGAGHGSFLPFAIYGAPVSILPEVGLFAAPIWWALVGGVLARRNRRTAALMMAVHGAAVGMVLWLGTPGEPGNEQWEYFRRTELVIPGVLWGGIAIYLIGQVIAWMVTIKALVSGIIKLVPDSAG